MAPAKPAIEGLDDEVKTPPPPPLPPPPTTPLRNSASRYAPFSKVTLPTHYEGKDPRYLLVVAKYELIRLVVLEIEQKRCEPRRMEFFKGEPKSKKGKNSYVKATTTVPSQNICTLLWEAKVLRRAITGMGAPDMPLPAPLSKWMSENGMTSNLE